MKSSLLTMFLGELAADQAAKGEDKAGQTPAEQKALQTIEKLGGSVRTIAQNDDRLEVDFHLQPSSLTDEQLATLQELKKIVHLHLGNTNITDRGLAYVEPMTALTELHLEKTKVTDAGLAHLKNLKNLSYLNLYGTGISDAGLVHLKGLTNLKKLYLWQTKVTSAGVDDLRKALHDLDVSTGGDTETSKTDTKPKGETQSNK
jgi:hypothetical protein